MTVPLVFLGKMRSHLGQCLVRGKSDTDRNTHALSNSLMKVFTPSLQIQVFHAIHIDEAFVNGIAEIGWHFLTDDFNHPCSQFSIQFIVGGEYGYLLIGELLGELEIRSPGLDTHLLCLIASGNHTAIIVAQNHHRLAVQVRAENPLAAYIAIVTINDAVHTISTDK